MKIALLLLAEHWREQDFQAALLQGIAEARRTAVNPPDGDLLTRIPAKVEEHRAD